MAHSVLADLLGIAREHRDRFERYALFEEPDGKCIPESVKMAAMDAGDRTHLFHPFLPFRDHSASRPPGPEIVRVAFVAGVKRVQDIFDGPHRRVSSCNPDLDARRARAICRTITAALCAVREV